MKKCAEENTLLNIHIIRIIFSCLSGFRSQYSSSSNSTDLATQHPHILLTPTFTSFAMSSLSFVDFKILNHCFLSILPQFLSFDSHAASFPLCPTSPPFFFSFLLFCHSYLWWEALFLRALTPGRLLPGFWQTLIRDDAAVCQAIQIISGIKRSIASFLANQPPHPHPVPDHRSSRVDFFSAKEKLGGTKKNLRGKLCSAPEVIYKKQGNKDVSFTVCWSCHLPGYNLWV